MQNGKSAAAEVSRLPEIALELSRNFVLSPCNVPLALLSLLSDWLRLQTAFQIHSVSDIELFLFIPFKLITTVIKTLAECAALPCTGKYILFFPLEENAFLEPFP